ncbi:MAG: calcium-binding protein [Oceanicaulis sp.]
MAFLTAQDFIDVWAELDAAYVTFPTLASVGGNYQDSTLVDTTGAFEETLTKFDAAYGFTLDSSSATMGQLALAVNTLFVELGNAYVDWLDAGNPPILDIAKDRGGAPAPGQTFHDNILGNLGDGPISDRFGSSDPADNVDIDGNGIGDLNPEPRSLEAQEFGDRPYVSGNTTANMADALAWDLEHGVNITANYVQRFSQSFESGTGGFVDGDNGWHGQVTQVASGTDGIVSADGASHAIIEQSATGAPFTRFNNYGQDFGDGFAVSTKIYLDQSWASGEGFDWSVAVNNQSGTHLRDFIFHITKDPETGSILIGADNNSNGDPILNLETRSNFGEVTDSGWYTFSHVFFEASDGSLAVAMTVYDANGDTVFHEVRNDPSDDVESLVGGNRYGWFTNIDVAGGIAVDDVELLVSPGLGTIGNDTLVGTDGNDLFIASAGNDVIDGGAGEDTYDVSANNTVGAFVDLQSGISFGGSQTGFDTLSNIENLRGGDGLDLLNGNADANTFFLSAGADQIDGRGGLDTVDASAESDSVSINLSTGSYSGTGLGGTFQNVENATGGAGDDTLTGDAGANVLSGLAGDDALDGGAGDDMLDGGDGADTLDGGAGADTILGGAGDDTIVGDTLDASVDGGDGFDTMAFAGGTAVADVLAMDGSVSNVEIIRIGDTPGSNTYVVLEGMSIQDAIDAAAGGDTIVLGDGVHVIDAQIVIDKDLSLEGQGQASTTLELGFDTGTSGDARGWFLVNDGVNFSASELTFDGAGHEVWQAVRHKGSGTFDNVTFTDIKMQDSGQPYQGTAIAVFGATSDVDVTNSTFTEIGRIGVLYFGADVTGTFANNVYVGKGAGDHLDYALDISAGADIDVTGNAISNNQGVAASDGSASAGVLVSTFFGAGSEAYLEGNTFTDNSNGVYVGFDATDASVVEIASGNTATGGQGMTIVGDAVINGAADFGGDIDWNGGAAANAVTGGAQADTLSGGSGDDVINGNAGDDALNGGDGNDTLDGGDGADSIEGGAGDDLIIGDTADASIDGGDGFDTMTFAGGTAVADVLAMDGSVSNVEIIRIGDTPGSNTYVVLDGMSIQDAIGEAADGDTIVVGPGTFSENLLIDKGVTLLGAQSDELATGAERSGGESVINGGGTFAVTIISDDVTFAGFEITDFGRDGINIRTLENADPSDPSIGAYRSDIIVENNWIHSDAASGQRNGILVGEFSGDPSRSTEQAEIEGLQITGNHIDLDSSGGRAMAITNHFGFITLTDAVIDGNTFDAATSLFGSAGPNTFRLENASLTGNTFEGTVNSYNFFNSSIDGNTFNGLTLLGLDGSTVSNNVFNVGDFYGLGLWGSEFGDNVSQNSAVEGNTFNYNDEPTAEAYNGAMVFRPGVDASSIIVESNTFNDGGANTGIPVFELQWRGGAGDDILDQSVIRDANDDPADLQIDFNGGAGDDLIVGDTSDASVDGGDGFDTLAFAGGTLVEDVLALEGAISNVEIIRIGDAPGSNTYVVLDGMSIQDAVDAASVGDTIQIATGTFAEAVTVTKQLTILGANAGVAGTDAGRGAETVIDGGFRFSNGSDGSSLDGVSVQNGPGPVANTLIYVDADSITVSNSVIESQYPADGFTSMRGILTTGGAEDLTVSDNLISQVRSGIYFNVGTGAVVTGNTFADTGNGINADGPEISDISGNHFEGSAGANIALGAIDDPTDMSAFVGANTFEPGTGNVTIFPLSSSPDGVEISGTNLDDSFRADIDAGYVNQGSQTFNGLDGDDDIFGGAGDDTLNGDAGDDTVDGGAGDDTLDGGAGSDTILGGAGDDLIIGDTLDASVDGGDGFDTMTFAGGTDVADVLAMGSVSNVEIIRIGDAPGSNTYVVLDGMSIQDAIGAAADGDTIVLGDGTFAGNVIVNKDVTIEGANAGLAGDDAGRGAESVIDGAIQVLADGVSIDGVQVQDGATIAGANAGVLVQADNVTIENSVFDREGGYGGFRGIVTATGDAQGLVIDANAFTGWATGVYLNPGSDAVVTGNLFDGNNVGLSNDGPSASDISGNTFQNAGVEHIGIGAEDNPSDVSFIGANTFDGPTAPVTIYALGGDGQVIDGSSGADVFVDVGGHDDVMNGGAGDDTLNGGAGNDTLDGGAGDDAINAGDGDDLIVGDLSDSDVDGGAGFDTVAFASGVLPADIIAQAGAFTDVEIIRIGDAPGSNTYVVLSGMSIQDAIGAAADGDTIVVADGTYAENLTIDKALSFEGQGVVQIAPAAGAAISIEPGVDGDLSFDNVRLLGGSTASIGIDVEHGANVGTLSFTNGQIVGFVNRGLYATDNGDPVGTPAMATLIVSDTVFDDNGTGSGNTAHVKLFGYSGDATFDTVTFDGASGTDSATGRPDNAIEITGFVNSESNANPVGANAPDIGSITLENVTVTGEYHKNPVAFFNFGEIDGLDIISLDLSGAESIWGPLFNIDGFSDQDIDASGFGITFPATSAVHAEIQGEKDAQGPVDSTITGTAGNDSLHGKDGDDTLNGGDGDDILYGGNKPGGAFDNGAGDDTLNGGAGDDTLVGGIGSDTLNGDAGDDTLDGGDGADTLDGGDGADTILGGAGDDLIIGDTLDASVDGGDGFDTMTFAGGTDVADVLAMGSVSNVEIIRIGDAPGSNTYVVLDGMSIQDAIGAAADGDTIVLGDGTFAGNVIVNKDVTIEGANAGLAGDDAGRGAESVIDGAIQVLADGVSIDGVQVQDGATIAGANAGVLVQADNVTIENSVFDREGGYGGFRGIVTATGDAQGLVIDANAFTGWATGVYLNPGSDAVVTGNLFDGNNVGLSNDGPSASDISGNTFQNAGVEHIGIGAEDNPSDVSFIGANTFDGPTAPVTIYALGGDGQVIDGSSGADVFVDVGGHDDVMNGGAGDDTLNGGAGNDTLDGGAGDDAINAGDGDDLIVGDLSDSDVDGGAGFDTVAFASGVLPADIIAQAGAFTDVEIIRIGDAPGSNTYVVLSGMSIQDAIGAAADGDTIVVADGSYDAVTLDKGVTLLSFNDGGAIIDGPGVSQGAAIRIAAGVDGASVGADGNGFVINAASGDVAAVYAVGDNDGLAIEGNTINGGSAHAFLSGASGGEGVSNSTLANNTLTGDGPAALVYNNGAASLGANSSSNAFTGNVLIGGAGAGLLMGIEGDFTTISGNTFDGAASYGALEIFGASPSLGSNTFNVGGLILHDGPGSNDLSTFNTDGSDTIFGNDGDDILSGGLGDDTLNGGAGSDTYDESGSTADMVVDLVAGTATGMGSDTLSGIENVRTGSGDDTVIGNAEINVIDTGDGDDWVRPGAADDDLDGGAGVDTLDYSDNTSKVTVDLTAGVAFGGQTGVDQIANFEDVVGGSGDDVITGDANANRIYASAGDDEINGGGGTDTYDASDSASAVAILLNTGTAGGAAIGNDTLTNIENAVGSAFSDTMFGDANANRLEGGAGNDNINGGAGDDELFGDDGADTMLGGAGDDFMIGGAGNDDMNGGDGDDTVRGGDDDDIVRGGAGDDIVGGQEGDDTLFGDAGDDELRGGVGDDVLDGGTGDDLLFGGDGDDFVDGGAGFDTAGFNGVLADYAIDYAAGTVTNLTNGDVATLDNIERLQFADAEFRFVNPDAEPDNDLDGDGAADFVFRRADNTWETRSLDGTSQTLNAQADEQLRAIADFNGDGVTDTLFERTNGAFTVVDGASGARTNLGNAANDFAGVGDFDGDGAVDVLLTSGGDTYLAISGDGSGYLKGFGLRPFELKAIGDVNGDGVSDLVFERSNGSYFSVDGDTNDAIALGNAANTFLALADFNGDGKEQMLLSNAAGNFIFVAADGGGFQGGIGSGGRTLAGVGDFDGDGAADLLLFDSGDDSFAFADMSGNVTDLGPIEGTLAGVDDYNGDGVDDLLFENTDGTYSVYDPETERVEYDVAEADLTSYADGVLDRELDLFIV